MNDNYASGHHQITWNECNNQGILASPGVCIYEFTADEYSTFRKMIFSIELNAKRIFKLRLV